MKSKLLFTFSLLLAASPILASAEQLVPAGSILKCTVSDKISSKTEAVGDPVMCTLGHTEAFSRTVFPYGSYLIGHFEEYKDPGHFVGKGWMELRFDRLMIQPDTNVPINARVVAVPKYPVDAEGRTHFAETAGGKHRYLTLSDAQKTRVLEALVLLATEPRSAK